MDAMTTMAILAAARTKQQSTRQKQKQISRNVISFYFIFLKLT